MAKVTRLDQLRNKANFLDEEGDIYLVRCMACPDAGKMGRENWAPIVASGICAWCGWEDKRTETFKDMVSKVKDV